MKTEFELDAPSIYIQKSTAKIIGEEPDHKPYVAINITRRGFAQVLEVRLDCDLCTCNERRWRQWCITSTHICSSGFEKQKFN